MLPWAPVFGRRAAELRAPATARALRALREARRGLSAGKGGGGEAGDRAPLAVILDMDECLIHSQFLGLVGDLRQDEWRPEEAPYDDTFMVELEDGAVVRVNRRPELIPFLKAVTARFPTYIFTAATEVYASPVLDVLEKEGSFRFAKRFYRPSCRRFLFDSGGGDASRSRKIFFVKDLEVCGVDLRRAVLVDNNPMSFLCTPRNGIPIADFYNDAEDGELTPLVSLLEVLDEEEDVRVKLDEVYALERALKVHIDLLKKCDEV